MSTAWGVGAVSPRREVDEIVVDRLVAGHLPATPPTSSELAVAIARLDAWGYSARQVADRIGITPRSVHRHRTRRKADPSP